MANPTVNVYIDGFNLYYGKLKGQPYKWLDIQGLFEDLMPGYEVKRVKYFTARVKARPGDLQAPTRQSAYLRALATLPKVSIYYGQYTVHNVRMALSDPNAVPRTVEVIKTEEKGSDVNLAAHLMMDAFRDDADVKTYDKVSKSLMRCKPDFIRDIRVGALQANQLPDARRKSGVGADVGQRRWRFAFGLSRRWTLHKPPCH